MHNYWSPKLQVILIGKWNSEKTLKIFIGFVPTSHLHVTGENQVHWLIIQLIQNEVLAIMYSKYPKNQTNHSHTLL